LTSPEPHGIYLAVEYTVATDGTLTLVENTAGVLVPITDDVRSIHLFEQAGEGVKDMAEHQRIERKDDPDHEERGITPHREPPPSRPPRVPPPEPRREPPPPPPRRR
jgi:hypothetical protein